MTARDDLEQLATQLGGGRVVEDDEHGGVWMLRYNSDGASIAEAFMPAAEPPEKTGEPSKS